jgi:hypothetical protein
VIGTGIYIYYLLSIRFRNPPENSVVQTRRSRFRFSMRSLDFLIDLNPSSHIMALVSTQPLTEMSTRNLSGGKEWPALKPDNFTAICDPIV